MPKNFIQDIAGKIQEALPEGVKNVHGEAERFVKEGVDNALSNFKFVRYEEFEIQQKILLKTREKLELLTKRVEALEAKLNAMDSAALVDDSLVVEAIEVIETKESKD